MKKTDHNRALIEMIHAIGEFQSEIEDNYTNEEKYWIAKALRNMVYLMKCDRKEGIPLDVLSLTFHQELKAKHFLKNAYRNILISAKRLKKENERSKK